VESPNLLVTYRPGDAPLAEREVEALLGDLSYGFHFLPSRVRGLFQIGLKGDPKEAVSRLREVCLQDPGRFQRTYRWIPVDLWTASTVDSLRRAVRRLASSIKEEERWRLSVTKRYYEAHTTEEVIRSLAEEVDRPLVDLEKPDIVIRVEIIGGRAGVAIHRRHEFLNVNKVRRELGLEPL
jgi:tRNA(Ser,Leu) C12 N-acetylase TAN1